MLLRAEADPSPHTLEWRAITGAQAHYFIHPWHEPELAALARQVTGRGLGLVLGGGARGFAHIGLVRALEQLEIPVDVMGGTSMGAFVSSLLASGFDSVEMTQIARQIRADHAGRGQPDREALLRWKGPGKRPSLAEIISRTATLTADTTGARQAAERADHFIRMPVQAFGMFDWPRLDEPIDIGYRHAMEQLEPVRASLTR